MLYLTLITDDDEQKMNQHFSRHLKEEIGDETSPAAGIDIS